MPKNTQIFNDPIYGVMDFNENQKKLIVKYIDTPIFQRLRRINQLGVADYVFPGATHSRFSHSLGACYIAKNLSENLIEEFKNKEELNSIIIAALLHDIGHGPFSHSFEYALNEHLPDSKKIYHDKNWQKKFYDEFSSLSDSHNEEINQILEITKNHNSFPKSIISSQLDVDRLDYLQRDSHFCGVPYGKVDLRWIIKSIEVANVNNNKILAIKNKGIGAVEHYLSARRLMNKNIYYNTKVCAIQFYLKVFIQSLEDYIKSNIIASKNLLNFLKNYFKYKNESNTSSLEFINENYKYYKKLTDDDIFMQIKIMSELNENSRSCQIANCIINRKLPICHTVDKEHYSLIKEKLDIHKSKLSEENKWKLHIEKFNIQTYEKSVNPIYVNSNDSYVKINDRSEILNFHSDKEEEKYLLYVDQSIDDFIF